HDPAVLARAAKIGYTINPNDEYPKNFTGHLLATLNDGSRREFRQPYMRGGAHAPLAPRELEAKFMDNALFGGWNRATAEKLLRGSANLFSQPRLGALAECRS